MRAVEPWERRGDFEHPREDGLNGLPESLTCTVCHTVVDGTQPHCDGDRSPVLDSGHDGAPG